MNAQIARTYRHLRRYPVPTWGEDGLPNGTRIVPASEAYWVAKWAARWDQLGSDLERVGFTTVEGRICSVWASNPLDFATSHSDFDGEPEETEYYGLVVEIRWNGRTVGEASVWGIGELPSLPSAMVDAYMAYELANLTAEAAEAASAEMSSWVLVA